MVRIQLELDERTVETLRQMAAAENRSESELVRDVLDEFVQSARRRLPIGAGKYRSGSKETSERTDEILKSAVEQGEWP